MHIAIDGVGNHVGGGWSVLVRTVAAIAADDRVTRVTVFCSPLELCPEPAPSNPKINWVEHRREHAFRTARLAWHSVGFDIECDRVRADAVLSMNGVARTARPRVCLIQQAFTVWGSLTRVRPKRFAAKLLILRRETARSAKDAERVVVQTSWMREQVGAAFDVDALVLPLGLPVRAPKPDDPSHPTIASIGSSLPYKRTKLIADSINALGRNGLHTVISDVSPAVVEATLRRSSALTVASDVESFGLPIVEAFANGCPVVCTDRPWSRAVAGDGAAYFAHGSQNALTQTLGHLLAEKESRAGLRDLGYARLDALWQEDPYTRLVDLLEEIA